MNLGLWTTLHYKYMGGIAPSEFRFHIFITCQFAKSCLTGWSGLHI